MNETILALEKKLFYRFGTSETTALSFDWHCLLIVIALHCIALLFSMMLACRRRVFIQEMFQHSLFEHGLGVQLSIYRGSKKEKQSRPNI